MINLISAFLLHTLANVGGFFLCAAAFKLHPKIEIGKWYLRLYCDTPAPSQERVLRIAELGAGGILVGLLLLALYDTPGAWVDKPFLIAYGCVTAVFTVWKIYDETH